MKTSRLRFLAPNAFTAFNFLLGVYVILLATGALDSPLASKSNLVLAGHVIVICALLDKLDGFAAKLLNASSEFGAQFDSLADLIAFGVAPALAVIYAYQQFAPNWYANNQTLLMVALAVYVLCAAVRLARYNAVDAEAHPDWFVGLPSTFVGALNALIIVLAYRYDLFVEDSPLLVLPAVVLIVTAVLMVAPLYLPKLKARKNVLINVIQIGGIATGYTLGFAMIYSEVILGLIVSYAVVGLMVGIVYRRDAQNGEVKDDAAMEGSKP